MATCLQGPPAEQSTEGECWMPPPCTLPGTCSLSPNIAVVWLDAHRVRMEADESVRLALKRQDMEPVG
jgi:hypothetical protein